MTMLLITGWHPNHRTQTVTSRSLALNLLRCCVTVFQLMAPKKPIKLAWRGIKDILST
jgi:hypothetical protein